MFGHLQRLVGRNRDVPSMVRKRFAQIAMQPEKDKRRIGPAIAKELGYDPEQIDGLPASVTESFAGVGNPLSLADLHPGETVLDLGSGAGLDSILAASKVGPSGRVIGIDFTPEMIERAKRNMLVVDLENVTILEGEIESLPLPDDSADVAFCNGLFNLCPDKPKALAEVYRVLKPGGRFAIADVLLEDSVSPEMVASKGTWSD
jgi:arsenite methyltransferase